MLLYGWTRNGGEIRWWQCCSCLHGRLHDHRRLWRQCYSSLHSHLVVAATCQLNKGAGVQDIKKKNQRRTLVTGGRDAPSKSIVTSAVRVCKNLIGRPPRLHRDTLRLEDAPAVNREFSKNKRYQTIQLAHFLLTMTVLSLFRVSSYNWTLSNLPDSAAIARIIVGSRRGQANVSYGTAVLMSRV